MQSRFIFFICGLFAVVIITIALSQQSPQLTRAEVEGMIESAIETKLSSFDPTTSTNAQSTPVNTSDFGPAIESYLMANPSILQRMSVALQAETERLQNEQAQTALGTMSNEIYLDPDNVVLGNPDGDVTLVEFFDYNCGFCRRALADVVQLLEEDKNVRVILKEFPILSEASVDAARIAILVNRDPEVDYLDFHTKLFASRGSIDRGAALKAAQSLGMNPVELELQMGDQSVSEAIGRTYQLAEALGVSSTPNFLLGDELLRGAVGIEAIRDKVKNMRECGKATCNL